MKMSFYAIAFCSIFFVSCGEESKNSTKVVETSCYSSEIGGDLTAIQLIQNQEKISGYYAWEPKAKDAGHGDFNGKIEDGKIVADFTYLIEGAIQAEEVIFKLMNDSLVQGQGELVENVVGKLVIKDHSQLQWSELFNKTDCKNVKGAIDRAIAISVEIEKQTMKTL